MKDLFGGETRAGSAHRPKKKDIESNTISSNEGILAALDGLWEFAQKIALLHIHEDRIISIVSTRRVDFKKSGKKSVIKHEYMITLCYIDGIGSKSYLYSKGLNPHGLEDQFAKDMAKEFLNRSKLKSINP